MTSVVPTVLAGELSQTEFAPAHTDFARFLLPYQSLSRR